MYLKIQISNAVTKLEKNTQDNLRISEKYLISSKISGMSRSRCFILSFMAVMMELALSSAPCLEDFSAAPAKHTTQAVPRLFWAAAGYAGTAPPPRVQVRNDHSRTSTWLDADYK